MAAEALGPVRSNIPLAPELALGADLEAPADGHGHMMVDFGDDALTAGPGAPDDRPDAAPGAARPGRRRPGAPRWCCSTSCSATVPSPTRRRARPGDRGRRGGPGPAGRGRRRRHRRRPAGPRPPGRGPGRRPAPRSTCPTPRATRRALELLAGPDGTDEHRPTTWSYRRRRTCSPTPSPPRPCEVSRVDWRPPMPGTEADLATVAADPLRRDGQRSARSAAMLGVTGPPGRRRAGLGGARARARRVPARRAADHLGPRLRPAARRADGRRCPRGPRRGPGGRRRAVRARHRRVSLEPCHHRRRGRPDGRRGHADDVDVRARGPRHRRGAPTAR